MATRRRPPLAIRRSPIQGRGVFATRRIRKDRRLVEYRGERITPAEADTRYDDDAMERHHTCLFVVDDDTVIDGAVGGNIARFINHSCRPNCWIEIAGDVVWIRAARTIAAGEELFYDYNTGGEAGISCRCRPACRTVL
jgi:SET domain-containing protein